MQNLKFDEAKTTDKIIFDLFTGTGAYRNANGLNLQAKGVEVNEHTITQYVHNGTDPIVTKLIGISTCSGCKCYAGVESQECEGCGDVMCNICAISQPIERKCRKCHFAKEFKPLTTRAKAALDAIKFKCPHPGCNRTLPETDFRAHVNNCDCNLVSCPNPGCTLKLTLASMEEHILGMKCDAEKMKCRKCKDSMFKKAIATHSCFLVDLVNEMRVGLQN